MLDLNDLRYFVHVVDFNGFTAASAELGIPKSRLSRRIGELESTLEVKLLHRNTRQLSVTDMGASLYEHAKAMLIEAQAAENAITHRLSEPSGTVKLACSNGIADFALNGLIPEFMARYPQVTVVQNVSNHYVDPIAEGFDLVIRAHDKPLPDSELIQKTLAQVSWGLFAAPAYLEEKGSPSRPQDLSTHARLIMGSNPNKGWTLHHASEPPVSINHSARLVTGSMTSLKQAARDALGVAALPTYVCTDSVAAGHLRQLLPGWHTGRPHISLITTSRRGQLPAVKAFIRALESRFDQLDERGSALSSGQ